MSVVLLLVSILSGMTAAGNVEWQVRGVGTDLVVEATMEPGVESGLAVARLVPAPGGLLPEVEVVEFETVAADDGVSGLPVGTHPVRVDAPARAGGVDLARLVVARRMVTDDGSVAETRRVKVRLHYDRSVSRTDGRGVMGRLMRSVLKGGAPAYDVDVPGYLVVVPDDFYSNVLPLAEWKRRRGFHVWVKKMSETGAGRGAIRDYIRTAYETWDPVPSYVLLVGAVNKVEAFITGGTPCVTDHPFACVDGDDFMADLFVGRLPAANTSELDVMVAKIVGYERTPYVQETGWFGRALMVGTSYQEGGTPAVTALITKRLIRERMLRRGFTQVDTVFYPPTRYGQGPVDSAVNRGVSFVNGRGWGNHSGWGYPQFLINDVYGLRNAWKLPIVTSIYCGTGNYARNPCFGEAWLRAGTPSDPRGAVAFWGSSWSGTSTRWNNSMDYGIYGAMFDDGVNTCGPAMYLGKITQLENFPLAQDSFDLRVYFHVYNLLGDPSLAMWTRAPRSLTVQRPATFAPGASAFTVTVSDGDGPVAGARVCLHADTTVHAVERTDDAGRARFAVNTIEADTLFVTVTGRNLATYSGQIAERTCGVFVGYDEHTPATVTPAQAVDLGVTLRNFGGSQTASNVQAVLRSLDGCVQVTDSVRGYGDLAPGGAGSSTPFAVTVAAACTSGQGLRFELAVTSADSNWSSAFDLAVSGPTLTVSGLTVHDGNGWLDPGETAEISVMVRNHGAGGAGNISGTLQALDPAIVVLDSAGTFGTIGPGDSAANTGNRFQVRARDGIKVGRRFSLRLKLTGDGGFAQTWDFPIVVGEPVPTAPLGPDRYGYYAYDDTDAGCAERPDYDWAEIDPAHGGSGTKVDIGNDRAVNVPLPFTFRFYGREYNSVSVCDNGYVAMGNQWFGEIYNWHIPSPAGPDGFVAAFWDDFRTDTLDASGVFTWYDAANHRFVIEWSRCIHVHGFRPPYLAERQTFEAMLYDPQYHLTPTGDGPILVQFHTVRNDDTLFENSHNYATVGIQSPDHGDGVEYTFAGAYPPAAAEVLPHRAIRFTTVPPDTFTGVRERGEGKPVVELVVRSNPVRDRLVLALPAGSDQTRVQVFDAAGREVRRFEATGVQFVWDLTDRSGSRVPAGVYHVALTSRQSAGNLSVEKILVLAGE